MTISELRTKWDDIVRLAARARSRAIGRRLRDRYQDIVEQAVPEDMIDIPRAIDAKRSAA